MEREPATGPAARPRGGFVDRTFHALRVRNFRWFIEGQLLSSVGTWMQWVAAPWLVLQLTDSGVALGIDTALGALPILLFGAWGGVLADRFDNRRILIWTQSLYAAFALVLFALDVTEVVRVWHVYLLSFLTGIVGAADMPTRQAFFLEMVGPEDLTNAMSLNTATFTGSRIVGPVLAGAMIGTVGTAPVFLVNSVTYLAVVAALLAMRTSELHPRERAARARGQVREALRYVRRTPDLALPLALMAVVFTLSFNFSVLVPLLAVRAFHGDASTFGGLLALMGVGSLVAALVMASRSSISTLTRLAWFAIALGLASLLLALAPSLALSWPVVPLVGAAAIAFMITGNSTLQLRSAEGFRGRVMALYTVVFIGSTPVGGPIAGVVGEHLGPRIGLGGGAVIAVLAGLWALGRARAALPQPGPGPLSRPA